MCLYMKFFWSPCSLLISSQERGGRLSTTGCSTLPSEGGIKHNADSGATHTEKGILHVPVCSSTVNWRGFAAFRKGVREKNKL